MPRMFRASIESIVYGAVLCLFIALGSCAEQGVVKNTPKTEEVAFTEVYLQLPQVGEVREGRQAENEQRRLVKARVAIHEEYLVRDGDIIVGHISQLNERAQGIFPASGKTWPNGVVPYVIDNNLPYKIRSVVHQGINYFHSYTNVRFVPRTHQEDYIIYHTTGTNACYSYVGMQGDAQYVDLGNCGLDGFLHETMHALGFEHEHQRADRDNYIRVRWNYIEPRFHYAYRKFEGQGSSYQAITSYGPYDYRSTMHYGGYEFAKDRQVATIYPLEETHLGSYAQLSQGDINAINRLYPSSSKPQNPYADGGNTQQNTGPGYGDCPVQDFPKQIIFRCAYNRGVQRPFYARNHQGWIYIDLSTKPAQGRIKSSDVPTPEKASRDALGLSALARSFSPYYVATLTTYQRDQWDTAFVRYDLSHIYPY